MSKTYSLELSRTDLLNLAIAVSDAASDAYVGQHLVVAAVDHALAARLWALAGYNSRAVKHNLLAQAIDLEAVEAAVQAAIDEEAE